MLTHHVLEQIVNAALAEDAPWGDVTSASIIPEDAISTAVFVARQPGVMACGPVIATTMQAAGAGNDTKLIKGDGEMFRSGDELAVVTGNAQALLLGERVALNLLQRACGIATITHAYVEAAAGTKARIVDTRKTTPGLRAFEKHAVLCGGGHNHRFSLSDAVMVKDNHIATWRQRGITLDEGLGQLKQSVGHTTHIEVEVDDLETLNEVLQTKVADTILLDNFSLTDMKTAVELINSTAIIEASGGVNLETVAAIAATGVDIISVGALTHSVTAIDIGMEITS